MRRRRGGACAPQDALTPEALYGGLILSDGHGEGRHFRVLQEHDAERLSVGSTWMHLGQLSVKDHSMANYLARIRVLKLEQEARHQG